MFILLSWMIFGLFVGFIAKLVHPGEDPIGFFPTIAIGIIGSYIGGFLSWILNLGTTKLQPAGVLFGILGGIIACSLWRYHNLKNSPKGPKSFFTGKKLY